MADLGVEYLDLYLIHFPISLKFVPFETRYPPEWVDQPGSKDACMVEEPVPIRETWEAMEELVSQGLVKNIGVCNFGTSLLRDVLSYAKIKPSVLQVELHPYNSQEKLLKYCASQKIAVTGFSSFGGSSYTEIGMAKPEDSCLENATIKTIAEAVSKTPAQVVLRWAVQRGTAVIPKTSNAERLKENAALFDWTLSDDQMASINGLNTGRRFNDPGYFTEVAFNTFFPIYE